MAGVKALRKIQLGAESTAGTEVNATAIWRGEGTGQNTQEVIFPAEDVGILGGTDRAYIPKVGAEITFDDTPATFEQLPYVLEAGVEQETPTQDGVGSGYIYVYNFPTTAQNTLRTYTLEYGDDQQEEQSLYCFVSEFGLKGKAGEAVMVNAKWQGRQVSTGTYTAALSIPTVEEILFQKGKLYIDPTSTYPATTQKTNTFMDFDLSVKTGVQAVFTGDGQLYFSFTKQVAPEIVLKVTFEHDGTAVAEKAAWSAGTARSVRVLVEGSALGTAGTTYTYKTLAIDLVGKWETFDALGEQDGNDIVTGTLRCRYNGTAAALGKFTVVNELSALV